MLIWGSKGREKELSQGQFFCPKCKDERPYKHKRVSKYFTLYFIPLFEIQKLGEVVECQVCKSGFDPKILEPGNQVMFKVISATRYELLHGVSLAEVKSKLVSMGIEGEMADTIIGIAQK
jgi:zinc-ribbon family